MGRAGKRQRSGLGEAIAGGSDKRRGVGNNSIEPGGQRSRAGFGAPTKLRHFFGGLRSGIFNLRKLGQGGWESRRRKSNAVAARRIPGASYRVGVCSLG